MPHRKSRPTVGKKYDNWDNKDNRDNVKVKVIILDPSFSASQRPFSATKELFSAKAIVPERRKGWHEGIFLCMLAYKKNNTLMTFGATAHNRSEHFLSSFILLLYDNRDNNDNLDNINFIK